MNCPEFQECLQSRLDGEPPPERDDFEAHLRTCAECRERHTAALLLLDGLNTLSHPVPPADLAQRTAALVLRQRQGRPRIRIAAALALAASLLLAAFGLGWFDGLFGPQHQKIAEVPKGPEPTLTQSLAEAKAALAGVGERVADAAAEPAAMLQAASAPLEMVALDPLPRLGHVTDSLETTGRSLQKGGKGAAVASRAVSGLTRRALGYFLQQQPAAPAQQPQTTRRP